MHPQSQCVAVHTGRRGQLCAFALRCMHGGGGRSRSAVAGSAYFAMQQQQEQHEQPAPHHSLRMPAELSRMFSGLMSRWITRLAA